MTGPEKKDLADAIKVSIRQLQQGIDILEESRKAFKSKNLGTLRKNLILVLIETK